MFDHLRNATLARLIQRLISSPTLLAELPEVLGRAKFAAILEKTKTSHERSIAELRQLAETIDPPPLARQVCRDPDDDAVLDVALAAGADVIVTGDNDLLSLGSFEGVPILAPAEAVIRVEAKDQ